MTLTELAKALREAACDNGGMTAGLSPHQEHLTEVADRLEAIEKAWADLIRYMGIIGRTHYLRDCDASRVALARIAATIEGTEP